MQWIYCNFLWILSSLDVEPVDFASSQEAANIINTWCSNVTKNHISDIVTPGAFFCISFESPLFFQYINLHIYLYRWCRTVGYIVDKHNLLQRILEQSIWWKWYYDSKLFRWLQGIFIGTIHDKNRWFLLLRIIGIGGQNFATPIQSMSISHISYPIGLFLFLFINLCSIDLFQTTGL